MVISEILGWRLPAGSSDAHARRRGEGFSVRDRKALRGRLELRLFAGEAGQPPPKTHQRRQMRDKGIASVFKVEFEAGDWIDRRAPCRPALLPGERHSGCFEQEDSAKPPIAVA